VSRDEFEHRKATLNKDASSTGHANKQPEQDRHTATVAAVNTESALGSLSLVLVLAMSQTVTGRSWTPRRAVGSDCVSRGNCGVFAVVSRDPGGWLPMALPALPGVWLDNEWPAAGSRRGVARKGTDRLTT